MSACGACAETGDGQWAWGWAVGGWVGKPHPHAGLPRDSSELDPFPAPGVLPVPTHALVALSIIGNRVCVRRRVRASLLS